MNTRRINISLIVSCIIALLIVSGCKKNESVFAPLPTAWPRLPVALCDSVVVVDGLPVKVAVNPLAVYKVTDGTTPGLTVDYPLVNTHIYYTFIPVKTQEERDAIVESRLQRISLNLNGADARTLHGSDDQDNQSVVVVATSGAQTPVQLLADLPGYVVTATSFLDDPKATVMFDSIRPLVDMLQADMVRTLPGFNYDISND